MKQASMFPVLLPVFLSFFLFPGCTKDNNDEIPVPEEKITLSLASPFALPGDAIMVRLSKPISQPEVNISVNGGTVNGYASGDTAYVFVVPILAPGMVSVSIPAIAQSNTVSLLIKDYNRISDPQSIIDEFVANRNKSIDSITKVIAGSNFQPSPQSIILLDQVKEEWDLQMAKLSVADRELLAYVLQRNMSDPTTYSFTELPADYFAKPGGLHSDVGEKLVALAQSYVTAHAICVASIPFLLGQTYLFLMAPNPLSAAIFLGLFTTFVISREVAIRRAGEVGKMKGVAEALTESTANKPAEFLNDTEKSLAVSVSFRNLKAGDASLHAGIAAAYTAEQTFATKDKEVQTMYAKASAKTLKLKGTYPSYQSMIGSSNQANIELPLEGEDIIVKGVSDPRISFSSSLDGKTKKVKINSSATTEISFNLEVGYRRTLDGKVFTKDIACLYKPDPDSLPIYKAAVAGSWTMQWQDPGPQDNDQVDKFRFNADGTGEYYWMKPSGSATGQDIAPSNAVYEVIWSVRKQGIGVWYIDISYPNRGWSSSARLFIEPSAHCGEPRTDGLFFLGTKD